MCSSRTSWALHNAGRPDSCLKVVGSALLLTFKIVPTGLRRGSLYLKPRPLTTCLATRGFTSPGRSLLLNRFAKLLVPLTYAKLGCEADAQT